MNLGILSGGQLARMLILSGIPLGMRFRVLDPGSELPVTGLCDHVQGAFTDETILTKFAAGLDAITYEFENLPVETLKFLETIRPVFPGERALFIAQDRLREKEFFNSLSLRTAPFHSVESAQDIRAILQQNPGPKVLKTRREGYDGKGQVVIRDENDLLRAEKLAEARAVVLEEFVSFQAEVSVIGVRSRAGEVRTYEPVENVHRNGILHLSLAPSSALTETLKSEARTIAQKILESLNYVGVFCVELFLVDGRLFVNEMAPRVHNSGHWTIEGAETSQFENHIRAVSGQPLGSTELRGFSAMVNLVGEIPDCDALLKIPSAHLHLYAKEPRAGRKLGHVTIRADKRDTLETSLEAVLRVVDGSK